MNILNSFTQIMANARVSIYVIFIMLYLSGCDDFLSDAIWTQEEVVAVNNPDLDKCLTSALEGVPGVSIDHIHSQPKDIQLDVKLEKPIPSMGVNVRRLNDKNIQILFAGKGTRESDEQRNMITPLLSSIVNNIRTKCS